MTTWAIGDIQGCADAFDRLLAAIGFRPDRDRLWLCGDLVNRGPDSLGVLHRVRALGDAAVCVLGNHDLHLLAVAFGHRRPQDSDTFGDVLAAPDRDALLDWLIARPLVHREDRRILVHAGVSPDWDLDTLLTQAETASAALRRDADGFLRRMYGNEPRRWAEAGDDVARMRYTVNACTRMRFVAADGALDFCCKTAPGTQPDGLVPWFAHPARRLRDAEVFFGHWSTLSRVAWPEHRVWGLDTGCVWGGRLTAIDVQTKRIVDVPAAP